MLNETVGYVGWRYTDEASPDPENYTVYLEIGYSTYCCARAEGVWRKCNVPIEATSLEFHSPLGKTVAQCVTAPNTCRYILFTDGTALRIFNEPPEPGWVTLHSHAAWLLPPEEVCGLLERYPNMTETPVLQDSRMD